MTTSNHQIDVDLEQLRTSSDGIRHDTDNTLRPGISDVNGRIFRGLHVGERSQSGEVEATRRALAYAMDRFWRNGVAHVQRAAQMVEFLDKVLENYKTVDDFAKLDVNAVLAGFYEITHRPPAPQAQTQRGDFA